MPSLWAEIRNDHVETKDDILDDENCDRINFIDAWQTNDDNEEGKVIAKVLVCACGKISVIYLDDRARTDEFAQQMIHDAISHSS